ncbi:MAG: hypothetical protein WB697_05225 [Stellaceae bacterium]
MVATRNMPKRLGLGLALVAALAGAAWAQGASPFDGDYVGELTLSGIVNGDCTTPPLGSAYPLSVSGGVVRFKYVPRFDTTLVGRIDRTGSFKATGRVKSGVITMTGRVQAGNVSAKIESPSCLYSFQSGQ